MPQQVAAPTVPLDPHQSALQAAVAAFEARFSAGAIASGVTPSPLVVLPAHLRGGPSTLSQAAFSQPAKAAFSQPAVDDATPPPVAITSHSCSASTFDSDSVSAVAITGVTTAAASSVEQREAARLAARERAEREVQGKMDRVAAAAANEAAERRAAMQARFAERSAILDKGQLAAPRLFQKGRAPEGALGADYDEHDDEAFRHDVPGDVPEAVKAAVAVGESSPPPAASTSLLGADTLNSEGELVAAEHSASPSAAELATNVRDAVRDPGLEREMAERAKLADPTLRGMRTEEGVATSVTYESAPPPHLWPPALKRWVERCFAGCRTGLERAAMQKEVKAMVDAAAAEGPIGNKDWDCEPLPERDSRHDRKRDRLYKQSHEFIGGSDRDRRDDRGQDRRDDRYERGDRRDDRSHDRGSVRDRRDRDRRDYNRDFDRRDPYYDRRERDRSDYRRR